MSGVNDIVVYGFGGWSTVNKVPTLGFGIGAALDVTPGTVNFAAEDDLMQFRCEED